MRHTLIPTTLRKSLHHEYHLRAGVAFLFMFSMAWVVGIVSLLPSFVHVMTEKNVADSTLQSLKKASDANTSASAGNGITKQANALALFNDQSKGKTSYSSVIGSIVNVRGDVGFTSISVSRTGTTTVIVTVQGTAPSRDSLMAFKGRLESTVNGNKVDLPVSELAKSKDLQFSLTITNTTTP
jgi:hypothetical protein